MFCKNCGHEINDNADVCVNCGSLINKENVTNNDTAVSNENKSKKSKVAAALFAFFFGSIGVHNFYLGHYKRGAAQLTIAIVAIILFIIGSALITSAVATNPGITEAELEGLIGQSSIYMIFGYLFYAAVSLWAFVEFILILCGVIKDKENKELC